MRSQGDIARWNRIRFHQPDPPAAEIVQEIGTGSGIRLARPDDFRFVDIRRVINPVVERQVSGCIANNGELRARICFQLCQNARARQTEGLGAVPHGGPARNRDSERFRIEPDSDQDQAERGHDPYQRQSDGLTPWTPNAKVAHGL